MINFLIKYACLIPVEKFDFVHNDSFVTYHKNVKITIPVDKTVIYFEFDGEQIEIKADSEEFMKFRGKLINELNKKLNIGYDKLLEKIYNQLLQ